MCHKFVQELIELDMEIFELETEGKVANLAEM